MHIVVEEQLGDASQAIETLSCPNESHRRSDGNHEIKHAVVEDIPGRYERVPLLGQVLSVG